MKILVACEESQRVTTAFRTLGHEAYSCDIIDPSGTHPEYAIKQDVIPLLNGNCQFCTLDGKTHNVKGKWDMIIAFPPCTNLCASGQHWFSRGLKDTKLREVSIKFFLEFTKADCEKIAIENPVGIMSTLYRKPDQYIQPWQFGHGETKKTCLWLIGLPALKPTKIVEGRIPATWLMPPSPNRGKLRSKTYVGIAKAMAEQWGRM